MRVAVVGHVEWVEFARVDHVPRPGEIIHASETWEVPGGGGAVVAVQLHRLAGACTFFTALGDDELGHRAKRELQALGVRVEATFRPEPQRRAFTYIDADGERTITVIGSRLGPHASDPLPWDELDGTDAVYFCAGDDDALRRARGAKVIVATAREHERLRRVGVELDALVYSDRDPGEPYRPGDISPVPKLAVATRGVEGGTYTVSDGSTGTWPPAPLPGTKKDTYGAGDSFAAGLTYGLGAGMAARDAVEFGARCSAATITGRGPYEADVAARMGPHERTAE